MDGRVNSDDIRDLGILLSFKMGLRVVELVSLNPKDVPIKNGTIHVNMTGSSLKIVD